MKNCSVCGILKESKCFSSHIRHSDGLSSECKICIMERQKLHRKLYPWKYVLYDIKKRCNNKKSKDYKSYGAKGIKCLISKEELKALWERDKAFNLVKSSIDRINVKGNYEYSNCQFIEMEENRIKDRGKAVLQFTKEGVFIKEWRTLSEGAKANNTTMKAISQCLRNRSKTCAGYIWKYKENKC